MGARESNSNRMKCRLQGSEAISQATEAARVFGEAQRLTEDNRARLCIVIEELVANLYEHGGLTDEDQVCLSLGCEPGGIRIILADPGKPFDPRTATPNLARPERGGGVGIDLIRSWAQFVDYTATPTGNRLELMLPI